MSDQDCLACHSDATLIKEENGKPISLHVDEAKFKASAHSAFGCTDCHTDIKAFPHQPNPVMPSCATCHADQQAAYDRGIHAKAAAARNTNAAKCQDCHGNVHEILPASDPNSKVARTNIPKTCGACHGQKFVMASSGVNSTPFIAYQESVHGQAVAAGSDKAAVCTDCHGEHRIIKPENPASPVNAARIRETCGSCHGDVRLTRRFGLPADRLLSFDESFHGLAAKSGQQTVANCASCHGVHNILASADPKSTVNPKNLPKTCGKCHPGAGTRFAITRVHFLQGKTDPAPVRWVRGFYLLLIPATIGLMLLHNLGDWWRKLIRARFAKGGPVAAGTPRAAREMRMLPFERVEHAVLAVSFFTLVWTGFALKYPDQAWARPLLLMESAYPIRSLIHRIAAAVFLAVAVAHGISLIASRRLREHWREMLPKSNDPREALENFAYNIGLRRRRPRRSAHSYIEKAEYWAVVWGAAVMAASGLLLWANNWALRFLPKLWLDVATSVHFYEALLATLAIAVWHFYSVIFDPDVYPLDTAFLTGYSFKDYEEGKAAAAHAGIRGEWTGHDA